MKKKKEVSLIARLFANMMFEHTIVNLKSKRLQPKRLSGQRIRVKKLS